MDQDDWALNNAREVMKPYVDRITLVKTNFRDLEEVLRNEVEVDENRRPQVDGILFDLGVSSPQFDEGERV